MELTKDIFEKFQDVIYAETGISLSDSKITLVQSRLYSRLKFYNLDNFRDYLKIVNSNHHEKIKMINLITTNETYFFRESKHFDFLIDYAKNLPISQNLRVWSAASSVGAEAYSIAMILNDYLSLKRWEVIGTDINTDVLKKAKMALYCESWIDKIPQHYKKRYCLKGKGKFQGQFIIDRALVNNVHFFKNNLLVLNKDIGKFKIIFLRNVLIYFDTYSKQRVLNNVLANLEIGGYLIISLTENLDGLNIDKLKKVQSSIYQKIG